MRWTIPRSFGAISEPVFCERSLRDVLGEISAALELGKDQEDPDEIPDLVSIKVLGINLRPHHQLYLRGEVIDLLIAIDHALAQLHIGVEKGKSRPGEGLAHLGEQLSDLCLQGRHRQRRYPVQGS
jgi:hypothetical protein